MAGLSQNQRTDNRGMVAAPGYLMRIYSAGGRAVGHAAR